MANSLRVSSSRLDPEDDPDSVRPRSIYEEVLIDDGEFRLLHIEPADGSETGIVARLGKASIDDPPPYKAVSYRWGEENNSDFVMVNGSQFLVARNVFLMLSEFRRLSHPYPLILWIDSICIDQGCVRDRDNQVQLMGKIYSRARLVRMWIGTESDAADQAFKLIHHCRSANKRSPDLVAASIIQNEAGTKALTKILQRDYWNRMWVFQEIVLARQAVVHCGQLEAEWPNLKWLDVASSKHTLWHAAQIAQPWILEFRKALFRIAHLCISPAEARHISNVLHPTRHLLCQDPRDKLYALRGVCEAFEGIVKVKYSVPVRDVFTTFATKQILADGNLSTLLTAGLWNSFNGDDISLPSWVPDLRGMGGVDIRYLAGHQMHSFSADVGTNSRSWFTTVDRQNFFQKDGRRTLTVDAIFFDYVQRYVSIQGMAHSDEDRKELIKSFCFLNDDGTSTVGRLRQIFEGLIFGDKTTTMITLTERYVQERVKRLVLGFYEDLCQLFGPNPIFVDFLESFKYTYSTPRLTRLKGEVQLRDQDAMHLNRLEYLSRAAETTDQQAVAKTLFLSIDGNIGIGPRDVQRQDDVVVVGSCGLPLVLRPYLIYYKLVGPAYVSGIMQGEAVNAARRREDMIFRAIQLV